MTEAYDTSEVGSRNCAWADDYDLFSLEFYNDPFSRWDAMRQGCPVAHSERWGGSWMPVNYHDIHMVARDAQRFSSRAVEVGGPIPEQGGGLFAPPLTSDPPEHVSHRNVLQPFFTSHKLAELEPFIRAEARSLVHALVERGGGDAVEDFAEHLTIAVLAKILDVPKDHEQRFTDWVVRLVRIGPRDQAVRAAAVREILDYCDALLIERRTSPGDDLASYLATIHIDGQPLSRKHQLGSCFLILLAGADTTWSAIGASLWHLATHPEDRARLIAEPDLLSRAVEELLRVYAPVTVARIAKEKVELHGRSIEADERIILPLAAANRDPKQFVEPNIVKIDRTPNLHLTFGSGRHRCLGAGLATLELQVGLEEWLRALPNFSLVDPDNIRWSGGQVRGPEQVIFQVSR
jgi:cytochrome P450